MAGTQRKDDLDVSRFDRWQLLLMARAKSFTELYEGSHSTLAIGCAYHGSLGIWIVLDSYTPLERDTYPQSTKRLLWESDFDRANTEARKLLREIKQSEVAAL